jgi:hypothetical protein
LLRAGRRVLEGARRFGSIHGRSLPSQVWSLGVRLTTFGPGAPWRTCSPWCLSVLAHVDASALRGCNELVTSPKVSAETPGRALDVPIDTIDDSCAACAALGDGGGLSTWSELEHAQVDAPRSSSATASQRLQNPREGAPRPGAVQDMIAV